MKKKKIRNLAILLFIIVSRVGYGVEITEDLNNEITNTGVATFIYIKPEESNPELNILNSGIIKSGTVDAFPATLSFLLLEGSINNLANTGSIMGFSEDHEAYRIMNGGSINNIFNSGIIGNVKNSVMELGIFNAGLINSIENKGIITSSIGSTIHNVGEIKSINNNGVMKSDNQTIYIDPATGSIIHSINNNGLISATSVPSESGAIYFMSLDNGMSQHKNNGIIRGYGINTDWGNGIILDTNTLVSILNKGIIQGSNQSIKGEYTSFDNYGITAGQKIVDDTYIYNNKGVEIIHNSEGTITSITNGSAGSIDEKTIINGDPDGMIAGSNTSIITGDSYILSSNLINDGKNLIINGAGVDKGALIVDQNTILTGSIVNGYNTAMYVNNGFKVTVTDTVFNGGGLENDVAVIKGSEGNNDVTLLGNSIINGSVDLGSGDDTLLLSNTTQINGTLNGGIGGEGENGDILGLGQNTRAKTSTNLNILHNISGFETINTNGNVTLFETTKVTGAEELNLESGNLTLRVDPTLTNAQGKIIGHALYENNGTINSTGGKLVIGLNGLGADSIVSMGKTTILSNVNDNWWKDTDSLITNSLVLDGKLSENGKDVHITVKESIPLKPSTPVDKKLYEKLNEVYKSIFSAEEIGELANTTLIEDVAGDSYLETVEGETGKTYEDSLGGLLIVLDQIYANNPYTYTLKSGRDSLKLFEDNMSYLTIKPEEGQWIAQGKAIYTGVKNDNDASGKNYYGFDTGHRNYKTTTNTVGGLATFEYGLSDKTSLGVVFGGNNQDINFKGTSSIDGNSLYLGTFAKTEKNQFKFMTGLGYQYTSNDVNRSVSNQYDSFKTDEKYDVNSLNAFIEGKYSMNIDNQIIMEPKIRLSYYYVDQDKIDEGYTPGEISMKAGKATSSTGDLEIGIDFKKELTVKKGKLNNIVSIGVINTIGTKEKSLHGNIIGKNNDGSTFDIQGVKLPTTSGKVTYNMEFEELNGMIYSAGVNFEFAKDNNRNVNATLGLGYRF